jgi:hypothetical protein
VEGKISTIQDIPPVEGKISTQKYPVRVSRPERHIEQVLVASSKNSDSPILSSRVPPVKRPIVRNFKKGAAKRKRSGKDPKVVKTPRLHQDEQILGPSVFLARVDQVVRDPMSSGFFAARPPLRTTRPKDQQTTR